MSASASNADNRRQLRERIISGAILLPLALAITWEGGVAFRLLLMIGGFVALWEWAKISLCVGARLAVPADSFSQAPMQTENFHGHSKPCPYNKFLSILLILFGVAYIAAAAVSMDALRHGKGNGFHNLMFLFVVVWACDIGAFTVGRTIGGPRLAPSISPGKTWSGAIGGTVCAILAGATLALAWEMFGLATAFLLSLTLAIAGQGGDLFESWLKRRAGVKDSGKLIPGHGGLLDRIDALLAAAIVMGLWRGIHQ